MFVRAFPFKMKILYTIILSLTLISAAGCQQPESDKNIKFGNEVFINKYLHLVEGKRIGLVANQTSVLSNGTHLLDTLLNLNQNVTPVYSLEHGFKGKQQAGTKVNNYIDEKTGIPVYSLYGSIKKPTAEMLNKVDVILFDVQDIGARFYTYISSLYYVLQAAAENNKPVIVLDRPNPINGVYVDGPVLKNEFKSFVGIAPLPVTHGMTIGELAQLFVDENFIQTEHKPKLTIIKSEGWNRNSYWNDYRNDWLPTSPNIPDFETALVYPGTCFLEGTNISEGRGTEHPFLIIGAPFVKSDELITKLNNYQLSGVELTPITFTPVGIPGKVSHPKYEGIECGGIKIHITDKTKFRSVEFGLYLLSALINLYPDEFEFNAGFFDKLAGTDRLRKQLISNTPPEEIIKSWQKDIQKFKSLRNKYLLY